VYARVLELLPAAVRAGKEGSDARDELVRIGQIVKAADRFHSEKPEAWSKARMDLERLGPQGVDAAAVRLILKLRTHDPEVIARVQKDLLALGSGAIRHLVLAVRSPPVSAHIKERCIDTLVRTGPASLPALLPLLDADAERSARYYGAKALGKLEEPRAVPALAEAEAREADPLVRCAMLESLSLLGGERAVAASVRALRAEDLSVVKFGARALARLGASAGVPALVDALDRAVGEKAEDVRDEILKALRLITGRPGPGDPAWWRERLPK
jgi:HEAT repeat protein